MHPAPRLAPALALLAFAAAAASCGGGGSAGGLSVVSYSRQTITVGLVEREYFLHVPAQYTPGSALPVMIFLHGHGGSGADFARLPSVLAFADRGVFVVVPTALNGDWVFTDQQFLDAILTHLHGLYGSESNAWIIGFSDGGGLALQVGYNTTRAWGIGTTGITVPTALAPQLTTLPLTVQVIGTQDPHYDGTDPDSMVWDQARDVVAAAVGVQGPPSGPVVLPGGNARTTAEVYTYAGSPAYVWVRVDGTQATHRVYQHASGDGVETFAVISEAFKIYGGLQLQ